MSVADPEYHRRWRVNHKASVKASLAKWAKANAEQAKAAARRRRKARPEVYRAADRRRYARNAERRAAAAQARRDNDREAYNALVRERRRRHPEHHKAARANRKLRESGGRVSAQDIVTQLRRQGGRCYYCQSELDRYEVDHFISLANGGAHDPSNIVIACQTCNRRKNRLNGPEFLAKIGRAA